MNQKIGSKLFLSLIILCMSLSCSIFEHEEREQNQHAQEIYEEIKTRSQFSENIQWRVMVQRVLKRLAVSANDHIDWEIILLTNPEVSTYILPGGKLAINTGMMSLLKTEAALAALIGHEMAHVKLHHGIEGSVNGSMINQAYSQNDEEEADREGLFLMAQAGYNPKEVLRFWGRIQKQKTPIHLMKKFINNHPNPYKRKSKILNWMGEALNIYKKSSFKYGLGEEIVNEENEKTQMKEEEK